MTRTVAELSAPTEVERAALIEEKRTVANHDRLLAELECHNTVEIGIFIEQPAPLAFPLTVATWNLERCLFVEASASKLANYGADLILLSELDNGMARSAQRNTARDLARLLRADYTFGVEFLELGLGSPIERSFCKDNFNERGFHGNAILSSSPLRSHFKITLPGRAHWFVEDIEQPRIGERVAVGAIVETNEGPFVVVSTHLESVADGPYREKQLAAIMDAVEAFAPDLPILIGGDMNTGNHSGGDYRTDTLFAMAESRGFATHGGPLDQVSTRPSLITRWPERAMKLDWFFSRGLKISDSWLEPSLDSEGKPLSDHDLLLARIEGFA